MAKKLSGFEKYALIRLKNLCFIFANL